MTTTAVPTPPQRRDATEAEAKALASPLRLRILRCCLHEARTNSQIAQALGRDPASTLHHVRTLVDTGFLEAQSPRRGARGSRELPYLATGRSWGLQNPGASKTLIDTFLEEVALVPAETVDASRMGLRLTAQRRAEFERRLRDLIEEFRRPEGPGGDPGAAGEPWSVFVAIHPDPNRPA